MPKHNPRKPGKNAPCPCGSGKVFKRCCLATRASLADPALDFLDALRDSERLPKLLNWEDFDFGVELHDPVVGDITRIVSGSAGKLPADPIALCIGLGARRHATAEVRARLCEELERRVTDRPDRLVHAAVIGLEDVQIDPVQIGLITSLYHHYILGRTLALQDLLDAEAKTMDPDLHHLTEKVATDREPAEIIHLADRLRPLGANALRYLEYAIPEDVDEAIAPLVGIIAAQPGLRAARILEALLFEAMTPELDRLLFDGFSRMADVAWPLLLYRVQHPEEADWNRLAAYGMPVRARYGRVFTPLMSELRAEPPTRKPMSDLELTTIASQLAELGDRRAVGHAVQMIRDREIRPAGVDALREAWTANGWWKEVDDALTALRRGTLILVGKGEQMNDHVRERLEDGPPAALESAQFRLNLLQEDWNRAFHEDLDWLRPIDIHNPGPREQTLMRAFVEFVKPKMTAMTAVEDPAARLNQLQHEWMRTPQAALDGRFPLAVIWEARHALTAHPSREEAHTSEQLADMYRRARTAWEEGDVVATRAELNVILALDPTHPFARSLLNRVVP